MYCIKITTAINILGSKFLSVSKNIDGTFAVFQFLLQLLGSIDEKVARFCCLLLINYLTLVNGHNAIHDIISPYIEDLVLKNI